jgi:long-chain acyl-CoA synthetase
VDQCRAVLKDLGVQAGSKVAIISNNRWEWATITAAAYSLSATAVPMYEAQLAADWTYILNDSQATVLFTANDAIMATVRREVLPNVPLLKTVLSLDAVEGQAHAFATAMAAQTPDTAGSFIQAPTSNDLANLIYTSGTTGKPKGVELTHENFVSNVLAAARTMVQDPHDFIRHDDCSLAFLPWAHSYGQTCELWMSISHGARMGISRGIPAILEDLQLVQPTVLFSVPTLYKKIYDGVHNLIETASPVRKRLMQAALKVGQARVDAQHGHRGPLSFVERMQFAALDKIVLSKIRARFGGRLRHGFVAGAACPSPVLNFMDSIGIPVCEGYGLTETSPIITINTPEQRCVGSVGRPIGGVTVYICNEDGQEVAPDQEGEICCAGPNVMRGYYKNEAATKEVISVAPDGVSRMFHTGDLGRQSESGFVYITGRLKEQYKLENGYVFVLVCLWWLRRYSVASTECFT